MTKTHRFQGFMPTVFAPQITSVTDFDLMHARLLFEGLTRRNHLRGRRPSIQKWAAELRDFIEQDADVTEEDVASCIEYLFVYFDQEWMPQIYSMRSFIQKYQSLRRARLISAKTGKAEHLINLNEVDRLILESDSFRFLISKVRQKQRFPFKFCIQVNSENFKKFKKKVQEFLSVTPDCVSNEPLRQLTIGPHASVYHFSLRWWAFIAERKIWKDWQGRLDTFVFDPKSDVTTEFFIFEFYDWAMCESSLLVLWMRYLKMLGYAL